MKRTLLFAALVGIAAPASADLCSLLVADSTCTFASDTSGGTATFTNPTNDPNVGSGVISPFLTTQVGGSGSQEFGVSTDIANVNQLPLDDKRDNNKFTQTFLLSDLLIIDGNYIFSLDANEPSQDPAKLLSIDTLRIWGRTGATASDPLLASNVNVPNSGVLDIINTVFPDLQLIYALGIANTLLFDATLLPGSGIGYDVLFTIPTSEFAGIAPNSRIVFTVGYGGSDVPGSLAEDGFEEWSAVTGRSLQVPEPGTLAMLGIGLAAFGFSRWRSRVG